MVLTFKLVITLNQISIFITSFASLKLLLAIIRVSYASYKIGNPSPYFLTLKPVIPPLDCALRNIWVGISAARIKIKGESVSLWWEPHDPLKDSLVIRLKERRKRQFSNMFEAMPSTCFWTQNSQSYDQESPNSHNRKALKKSILNKAPLYFDKNCESRNSLAIRVMSWICLPSIIVHGVMRLDKKAKASPDSPRHLPKVYNTWTIEQ